MGRRALALVALGLVCGGLALDAGARPDRTVRFTALFLPGGRVVAHPPAGDPGDESFVSLKLVGAPGGTGTGSVYTIATKDGKATNYRFKFTLHDGKLGLVGALTAVPGGSVSQKFSVTGGTGAYKGAHGTGTLGKRPGGAPGIVVTIQLAS